MGALKAELGSVKLPTLNRERRFVFHPHYHNAGPAVRGIEVSGEEARLARVASSHLNLVGKSKERDRSQEAAFKALGHTFHA